MIQPEYISLLALYLPLLKGCHKWHCPWTNWQGPLCMPCFLILKPRHSHPPLSDYDAPHNIWVKYLNRYSRAGCNLAGAKQVGRGESPIRGRRLSHGFNCWWTSGRQMPEQEASWTTEGQFGGSPEQQLIQRADERRKAILVEMPTVCLFLCLTVQSTCLQQQETSDTWPEDQLF